MLVRFGRIFDLILTHREHNTQPTTHHPQHTTPRTISLISMARRSARKRSAAPSAGRAQRAGFFFRFLNFRFLKLAKTGEVFSLSLPLRGHRAFRRADPKSTCPAVLKSIKILISFWTRFLIDFGSSWGAKLGSFLALLAAKIGQVASKMRLGSLSAPKT